MQGIFFFLPRLRRAGWAAVADEVRGAIKSINAKRLYRISSQKSHFCEIRRRDFVIPAGNFRKIILKYCLRIKKMLSYNLDNYLKNKEGNTYDRHYGKRII